MTDLTAPALLLLIALGFYSIAAFGLAYVVGSARISRGIREVWATWAVGPGLHAVDTPPARPWAYFLLELVECPACFGFWTGLLTGLAVGVLSPLAMFLDTPAFIVAPATGFWVGVYTAGFNFIMGRHTGLIREE